MIVYVLCLLTTVLSDGYGGVYGQSYGAGSLTPIDINNRNLMIKPNDNLVFSFEQLRKDQPPQVEQRNENIGRYMYRKPQITTPLPNPLALDNYPKMEPLPHVPTPIVPIDKYNNQWNHVSAYPPTIPPAPSTPKWADLSEILHTQSFPHYNPPVTTTSSYNLYQPHVPSVLPTHYQSYVPAPAPELPAHAVPTLRQDMNKPISHVPSKPVQDQRVHPEPPQLSANRGNHKFNWNDVTTTSTTTYVPPPVVNNQNRPPSSFPTLSPWADGFGK